MIRHLVLAHNLAGTDQFAEFIAARLWPSAYVNIMPQYRPAHQTRRLPELSRCITEAECRRAPDWVRRAGLRPRADEA